jgi:benzoyl-CoA reductase/2-hydroxyglutaryl-CoA dehydratase subunit BcrC/BadD/HgdB
MAEEKKVVRKNIMATKEMGRIMAECFQELDQAAKTGEKKIAWCTSVGPAELLLAMGFLVYYPENHGAMIGSARMAADLIPHANALGYSPDICSYLTSDIGSFLTGETPLKKAFGIDTVPKPDVLVFNTNQCRDVKDWFAWYARKFNVPLVGVHTQRNIGEITDAHLHSISKEIEALVEPLEKISGNKFDMDKFKEVVALSRECSELWKKVLETAANVPAPITFFDGTIHMGPAVVLRGNQSAVDYYKLLLKELEERVQNGVAAVELFASLETCVLASTYCNSWIFTQLDPNDPFKSMARAYTELFIVRSEDIKVKYMEKMMDLFKIDGVIYHDAKTCPNNSNNRYGLPQRLEEKTGIPSLVINGDLNDMRCVSDEQTKTNIEAFIEQLQENR